MRESLRPKTLIHAFVTDTYLPWAELFLESIRINHGEEFDVRIDVYNVSEADKDFLRNIFPGLQVFDCGSGYQELAQQQGVDLNTIEKWRKEITLGKTTEKNFPFKLFISVQKRYRQLHNVTTYAREEGYEYVVHSDIDIYIRKSLIPTLNLMQDYDVGLYFRKSANEHRMKTLGAFLVFRLTDGTDIFMKDWMKEIDAVPAIERWRGFGQSALFFATEKSNQTSFADFTSLPGSPVFSKKFHTSADLWLNSNSVVAGSGNIGQELSRWRSWNDLKSGLPRFTLKSNAQMRWIEIKVFVFRAYSFIKHKLSI